MHLFRDATNPRGAGACGQALVELAFALNRHVRGELNRRRPFGLLPSEVRALAFVRACPGCSASALSDYLGLTLPSGSRLAEKLVSRGLLERGTHPEDRRRNALRITGKGDKTIDAALKGIVESLSSRLEPMRAAERKAVLAAVRTVLPLISEPQLER